MAGRHSIPISVFLMGPTAVGKSSVAGRLYERLDSELISVDSGQIYRGMDIGTAKPGQDCLKEIPHHLIDIRDITEHYSAAQFREDALTLIESILDKGKTPILVGGTMFYFSILENGISKLPKADPSVRAEIERMSEQHGLEYLHQLLGKIDPQSAKKIRIEDAQRIKRVLEIHKITGQPPSLIMSQSRPLGLRLPYVKIALFRPRPRLHKRIEERFKKMIDKGLVSEVESLIQNLPKPEAMPSMRSVGYRQVIDFLREESTYDQLIEKGTAATRQLAKRQLTWLRNQSNMIWVDAENSDPAPVIFKYLQSKDLEPGIQGACSKI